MKPYREALFEFKRQYWTAALAEANQNIIEASKLAQVNRTVVYRYMHECGLFVNKKHYGNWDAPLPL